MGLPFDGLTLSGRAAAEAGQEGSVGAEDVLDDRPELASPASSALPKLLPLGILDGPVEGRPAGQEEALQPPELRDLQGRVVEGEGLTRGPELRRGVPGHALDDLEHGGVPGSTEPLGRGSKGVPVAVPVGRQGGQRPVLVAPAPAPPWPVHSRGEDASLAHLEGNGDRGRAHPPIRM